MKRALSLILAVMMIVTAMVVVPVSATTATDSISGWDGTTATAPAGSGTEEDPYQIATAENLFWIASQVNGNWSARAADDEENPYPQCVKILDGQYAVQTRDIDLNGKTFKSIGYYYSNNEKMWAFCGSYDGQGYRIYNGTVSISHKSHGANANWASGLFGVIYGATIKNVVLDNIQSVGGNGITGLLVGRAVGDIGTPTESASELADKMATTKEGVVDFNVIENCVTTSTCSVVSNCTDTATFANVGRVGGIVGMAHCSTIKNCINNATIKIAKNTMFAGGIAGTAGLAISIDNCINNGALYWDTTERTKGGAEVGLGGIVGFLDPHGAGSKYSNATPYAWMGGNISITNCYNSATGKLTINGNTNIGTLEWGGIVGARNNLREYSLKDNTIKYSYVMKNCHNLATYDGTEFSGIRVAGLVGSAWMAAGSAPLYVYDSFSVYHACDTAKYQDYGIARVQTNKSTDGKFSIVGMYTPAGQTAPVEIVATAGDNNTAQAANIGAQVKAVAIVTADKITPLTTAIYNNVMAAVKAGAHAEVTNIYMQRNVTDNSMARFTALIKGNEWVGAGFEVTVTVGETTYTTKNITVTNCFTTLNAYGTGESLTADEGYYYISFVVENMPTDSDVTVQLTPYVADATTNYYGATVSTTFEAVAAAD